VGFNAFVVAGDDEGVGDGDAAQAVPVFGVGDAGGNDAGGAGETDVAGVVVGGVLGGIGSMGMGFLPRRRGGAEVLADGHWGMGFSVGLFWGCGMCAFAWIFSGGRL
jgi:hypothetical protein